MSHGLLVIMSFLMKFCRSSQKDLLLAPPPRLLISIEHALWTSYLTMHLFNCFNCFKKKAQRYPAYSRFWDQSSVKLTLRDYKTYMVFFFL